MTARVFKQQRSLTKTTPHCGGGSAGFMTTVEYDGAKPHSGGLLAWTISILPRSSISIPPFAWRGNGLAPDVGNVSNDAQWTSAHHNVGRHRFRHDDLILQDGHSNVLSAKIHKARRAVAPNSVRRDPHGHQFRVRVV